MATFTDAPECVNATVDWSNGVLAPLSDKELENPNFISEDRVRFYSDNAGDYDSDMVKYSFRGPDVAAHALHHELRGNYANLILDVGCGTGRVAEILQGLGPYTNMDGLEPATGMLAVAEEKNLYQNTSSQYMYLDCGLEHDKYDAVVSSGTFVSGHMKSDCMVELFNIVKSGGFIVVTMRHEHLETVEEYSKNMRPTINKLVTDGKWQIIKDEVFPDWCFGQDKKGIDGHLFVFQKI